MLSSLGRVLCVQYCRCDLYGWYAEAHDKGKAQTAPQEEADRLSRQVSTPWQAHTAAGLVLSTLYLAMEWILQAPPANRYALNP